MCADNRPDFEPATYEQHVSPEKAAFADSFSRGDADGGSQRGFITPEIMVVGRSLDLRSSSSSYSLPVWTAIHEHVFDRFVSAAIGAHVSCRFVSHGVWAKLGASRG